MLMAALCLPVDVLIFYKEPFGVWGTLCKFLNHRNIKNILLSTVMLVFAFIPFFIMQAEAMFPEKSVYIVDKSKNSVKSFCIYNSGYVDGKMRWILKNSWTKHVSLTYNEKYAWGEDFFFMTFQENYILISVFSTTWYAYNLFSTLSLVMYLLKVYENYFLKLLSELYQGDTAEEFYLALAVLGLGFLPQMMIFSVAYLHWHKPFNIVGLEFFATAINIPLR